MADLYGGRTDTPKQTDANTGAAAEAELMVKTAATAHWLWDWVYGESTDGVNQAAHNSPHSNEPGHTHAGGVDGVPVCRPFASYTFGMPESLLTGVIDGARCPQITIKTTAAANEKAWLFNGAIKHVPIPGCPPDGAHFLAQMTLTFHTDVAHAVYVKIADHDAERFTIAIGFNDVEVTQAVNLAPGVLNRVPLEIWGQGTVASNTIIGLISIAPNQTATTP